MKRKPTLFAIASVALGGLLLCLGLAMVYVPAAFVVGGGGLIAYGLLGIEVAP
jgi:hypothetical protein